MKRSDYKYFYHPDFLDSDLHQSMLDPINHLANKGMMIDENGIVTDDSDPVVRNRYKDNSVLFNNLPQPMVRFLNTVRDKIIDNGAVDPVVFNISALINPDPDPKTTVGKWHKDYNLIPEISDPNKLWFSMYSLTLQEANSEFLVSPTAEWPNIWNIGVKEVLTTNKLFGHTMNLGHQYFKKDKNELVLLYIRWFDKG
jgi:hypothetical protein